MVGGTSTGGLIAVMLGRLHMSVDECIAAYMAFSQALFEPKHAKFNALSSSKEKFPMTKVRMESILRKTSSVSSFLDDSMQDVDSPCKVAVVARDASGKHRILRSYQSFGTSGYLECKIWDVVRETLPAATYPQVSDVDSGPSMHQNPIASIYGEARSMWPEHDIQLVSIGAGGGTRNMFSASLGGSIKTINQMLTDSEDEARHFVNFHTSRRFHLSVYRFNVAEGLRDVALDEYKAMRQLEAQTIEYLRRGPSQDRMRQCVEGLLEVIYEDKLIGFEQVEAQRDSQQRLRHNTDWLSSDDMSTILGDTVSKIQEGTGATFFSDPAFQSWLAGDLRTLFCQGCPGAGKTFLAAQVIDGFMRNGRHKRSPILYFFASLRHQKIEHPNAAVLASLLRQLLLWKGSISEATQHLFLRHMKDASRPDTITLLECLKRETDGIPGVYIVIDGLDELSEDCRLTLLNCMRDLQLTKRIPFMATSRMDDRTEKLFHHLFPDFRSMQINSKSDDMEAFLLGRMSRLPDVVLQNIEVQSFIKDEIMKRSGGIFLWATLLVDSLVSLRTVRHIKNALESAPSEIHDMYEAAFAHIEDQDKFSRELAFRVFAWLIHARRPMTAPELQHALAIEEGSKYFDRDLLISIDDLISVCGGLVTLNADSNGLSFIHLSVEEFFQEIKRDRFADAQRQIAVASLTYLGLDCFQDGPCTNSEKLQQRLQEYPFLDYAARFWGIHAREVRPMDISNLAQKLLHHPGKVASCWQMLQSPSHRFSPSRASDSARITALHLLAYFGLRDLSLWVSDFEGIHAKDSFGRDPLAWAIHYNQLEMMDLLLDKGADVAAVDLMGRSHLALAAIEGKMGVLERLLERGANPSTEDIRGQSILSFAAMNGNLSALTFIAKKVPDKIDHGDETGRTPLFYAAKEGHSHVVSYLVGQPLVNVNSQDERGETPLIAAAGKGCLEVITVLLAHPHIKVNVVDSLGRTALMVATLEGRIDALKLLATHRNGLAGLQIPDYTGRTPEAWAAIVKHQDVHKFLQSVTRAPD
ncbi:hypothetical protein AYL99_09893 [Fonsecaea erecta]|uniref:NACHT domain-containing protein n=1 Tax=Fonsecaea erecta TaxID=1367422 RepID=A0A178Z8C4_9EURO|nr:hypothetical protein AYL99_09893 [Fonsecaea erecta]OAP55741.1 hypothetical protein AYL99_09893 [Fonsecaea erecta]